MSVRAQIIKAARDGNLSRVRAMLDENVSLLDVTDREGMTPLCWAASLGHYDLAVFLIDRGADLRVAAQRAQFAPLHLAAMNGRTKLIQLLLRHGAEVDGLTPGGWTPLAAAACQGRAESVRVLITQGASPRTADRNGRNPLREAARKNHGEVANLLMQAGAEVDFESGCALGMLDVVEKLVAQDPDLVRLSVADGARLLRTARENGHDEVVGFLVSRGVSCGVFDAAYLGLRDNLLALLDENPGRVLDRDPREGAMPLLWAAKGGRRDAVVFLAERGADVSARDASGSTALHHAAASGDVPTAEWLLGRGLDVNARGKGGTTPLHRAAFEARDAMVAFLLERGADPSIEDDAGLPPVRHCWDPEKHRAVHERLRKATSPWTKVRKLLRRR